MDSFRVSSDVLGHTLVVSVHGDLDVATAPVLKAALASAADGGARVIAIDLTECTFLDSQGSRSLGLAARDSDVSVSLVCPPTNRPVMLVLELLGMVDLIQVRPTAEELPEPTP